MTILEEEKNVDEQLAPPRKKLCLSLSGRNRFARPQTETEPTLKNGQPTINTVDSYGADKMLNGCRNQPAAYQDLNYTTDEANDNFRIASLCNLGNTCFLNSVLYTLRFAPSFLHNLHHLATDLNSLNDKSNQTKIKSSSLGRTGVPLTTSGSRSLSSKDLLTFTSSVGDTNKSKIQYATEKLHDLFKALRIAEVKDNTDAYQPDAFLQALRELNPFFEGNQQHDAHELLVCLLDNIRETFQLLVKQRETLFGQRNRNSDSGVDSIVDSQPESNNAAKRNTRKSLKKKKSKNLNQMLLTTNSNGAIQCKPVENGHVEHQQSNGSISVKQESRNCFITEDFEGVTLIRTTCIECENVTETKERFSDICVPIETDCYMDSSDADKNLSDDERYKKAVVTSELLCGTEKYWCSICLRKNEAKRAVSFPVLPRLLILQLKRFSTTVGSTEKNINYMPTPQILQCFCVDCCNESQRSTSGVRESRHTYNLYSVIMHQGVTITAGHYVAYTKLPEASAYNEYLSCNRNNKQQANHQAESSSVDKTRKAKLFCKFLRHKQSTNETKEQPMRTGCRGLECCGVCQEKHAGSWLECDDEAVRIIPWQELEDKLKPNHRNTATPYLLFYVRSTT